MATGECNVVVAAAEVLVTNEARIAALERLVGKQALSWSSSKGELSPDTRRKARLHAPTHRWDTRSPAS